MKMRMVGIYMLLLATVWLALPGPLRSDQAEDAYKRGAKLRTKAI